ncbi:hypothetical protein MRX96_038277 [Rhipicephalus microplus]
MCENDKLALFAQIKDDLTVSEIDIVLKRTTLVIPERAQAQILSLAHRGHQGLVKTKQWTREKLWFPGIDIKVEEAIKDCEACQTTVVENKMSPLVMTPLPSGPWHSVAMEFVAMDPGCLWPWNKYVLVVVDDYSNFSVTANFPSPTSKALTQGLSDIITVHGTRNAIDAKD